MTVDFGRADYNAKGWTVDFGSGDEPVFLLRGQDPVAALAVRFWAHMAQSHGAQPNITAQAREHAMHLEAWAANKGKVPDFPSDAELVLATARIDYFNARAEYMHAPNAANSSLLDIARAALKAAEAQVSTPEQPPEGYDAAAVWALVEAEQYGSIPEAHLDYWKRHDSPARDKRQGVSWEDGQRILIFGRGEIGVTQAYNPHPDNFDVAMLLLEPGLGSAKVGDEVPDRPGNSAVYPVPGSVVLAFENAASVDVVLGHLLDLRKALVKREGGEVESGLYRTPEYEARMFDDGIVVKCLRCQSTHTAYLDVPHTVACDCGYTFSVEPSLLVRRNGPVEAGTEN